MTNGCETLREAAEGCRLVLVTATELEAAPLRAALAGAKRLGLAGKPLYVGTLRSTEGEESRVLLGVSGCDKVNAAILLAGLLQTMLTPPELVLQAGIAGAFPAVAGSDGAHVGDVVIATREAYSDTGSSSPDGWIPARDLGLPIAEVDGEETGGVFDIDADLVAWALSTLDPGKGLSMPSGGSSSYAVLGGPCVTSSTVTGTDYEARDIAGRWGALAESMEGAAAAHVCALYGVPFLEVRGISNAVGDRDRGSWRIDQAVKAAGAATLVLARAFLFGGTSRGDR